MNGITCEIQIKSNISVEEKILINDYHDSDTLKAQIRKTTDCYSKKGWGLISISSEGGFIYLKFRSSE